MLFADTVRRRIRKVAVTNPFRVPAREIDFGRLYHVGTVVGAVCPNASPVPGAPRGAGCELGGSTQSGNGTQRLSERSIRASTTGIDFARVTYYEIGVVR
ncbi:hypothetical protein GCM10023094_03440 [Rhodococcus olei]|uniref:Uncharacterized protein n=1 Tax=Rhodococcus olei TaxID=2161675 RepID=A0ABP8NUT1_9NOCA